MHGPPVYLVDDDRTLREAIAQLLRLRGRRVLTFPGAYEFLESAATLSPGCVLLDLRMPRIDGISALGRIAADRLPFAVVMMTAEGDIPNAVRAMQMGALEFLEKPVEIERLAASLERAGSRLEEIVRRLDAECRLDRLSCREADVLHAIADGKTSKEIARDLGISPRTVDTHRAHIMLKTETTTLAELVRLTSLAARRRT